MLAAEPLNEVPIPLGVYKRRELKPPMEKARDNG